MNIDDELIQQWEPKVQRFLSTTYVVGWDREDLAQELRIAIVKAAQGFQEDRGVLFHTYLHTAMVNTIRTLISKAQHTLTVESLDRSSVSNTEENNEIMSQELLQALLQDEVGLEEVELAESLGSYNLTPAEQTFIALRLEGLTMEEITEVLGVSSYKVRKSVRDKLKDFKYAETTEADGIDSEEALDTFDRRV